MTFSARGLNWGSKQRGAVAAPEGKRWIMRTLPRVVVALVAVAGAALASGGAVFADDPPQIHAGRGEMRAALLDAHLEGMKAGLKLTPDQEKAWAPFESALRGVARDRADQMRAARAQWDGDDDARPSLIDRLRLLSDRLARRSAEMKTIADAAAPLYASLDDGQKRVFGVLFRELARHGDHRRAPWRDEAR
jgi:hypothetical protein